MKRLAIGLTLCLSGCAWAPNSWNGTVYIAPYGKPVQSVAAGVSGPIPPFKYWMPQHWLEQPK